MVCVMSIETGGLGENRENLKNAQILFCCSIYS